MSQGMRGGVYPLPLWERVPSEARRVRGLSQRTETAHPARIYRCEPPSPTRGEGKEESRRVDAAKAVPHSGGGARGEHRKEALVLVIAVEGDPLQRRDVVGALRKD